MRARLFGRLFHGKAARLTSGVDAWLNTPLPPFEASGTSGMKAAHKWCRKLHLLDGWWIEGWIEGKTGWSIDPKPQENMSTEERKTRELVDLYRNCRILFQHLIINEMNGLNLLETRLKRLSTTLTVIVWCGDTRQKPTSNLLYQ